MNYTDEVRKIEMLMKGLVTQYKNFLPYTAEAPTHGSEIQVF